MKFSILRCLPKILLLQNRTISRTSRLSYVLRSQVLYAKDKKGGGGGGDKKCDDKNSKKPDNKKYAELSKKCIESVAKKGGANTKDKCKDKDAKKAVAKKADSGPKCKEVKVKCEKKEAKKEKDMTAVKGGSAKCKDKKKKKKPVPQKPKKQLSCEELIMKQSGMSTSKCQNLMEIRGGNFKCPREKKKKKESHSHKIWQRLSLFAAIPACVLVALFVFQTHEEVERGDFVPYTYKYKQTKSWFIKDPKRTPFHNPKYNALPEGYEDEIDEEAGNEPPETDKQKAESRKAGDNVKKTWKKKFAAREKEVAAAAAASAQDH